MKSLSENDIGVILGRESGLQEITATWTFPFGPIPAGSGDKGNQWCVFPPHGRCGCLPPNSLGPVGGGLWASHMYPQDDAGNSGQWMKEPLNECPWPLCQLAHSLHSEGD